MPFLRLFFYLGGGDILKLSRQVEGYGCAENFEGIIVITYLWTLTPLTLYCILLSLMFLKGICLAFYFSSFGAHPTETIVIAHYGLDQYNRTSLSPLGFCAQRSLWNPAASWGALAVIQRGNFRRHLTADIKITSHRRPYALQ